MSLFVCLLESSYKPYLKDISTRLTTELICRLENDPLAKKWFYESFGLPVTYTISDVLQNISEFFPDTPIKLLKDVFQALELHDLVEILERALKPRTLRPILPLKEIKKMTNASNRPTRYYNDAAVLIIDAETDVVHSKTERIGSFFKAFNSRSRVTTVKTTLPRIRDVISRSRQTTFSLEDSYKSKRERKKELELRLKDLKRASLGNYREDAERLLRTEVLEKIKELEDCIRIWRTKKVIIETEINQTEKELQKETEKIQMILAEWVLLCKGWIIQWLILIIVITIDISNQWKIRAW